jgi:hypothetical protein
MAVVMRIIQQFDPAREDHFMDLERKFAELEKKRRDKRILRWRSE